MDSVTAKQLKRLDSDSQQAENSNRAAFDTRGNVVSQIGLQNVHGNVTYSLPQGSQEVNAENDRRERERAECLAALLVIDPKESRDALRLRKGGWARGTCKWVLDCEEIVSWSQNLSPSDDVFWLYGHPGTGKSTVALFLVDALEREFDQQDNNSTLTYFFCDASSREKDNAVTIIRGIIYQLCSRHRSLLDNYLLPTFRIKKTRLLESFPALWDLLMAMGKDKVTGKKYCVIDALDECDEVSQKTIVRHLEMTFGDSDVKEDLSPLRFLITSRPYPQIREVLGDFSARDIATFDEVQQDLSIFIEEKMSHLQRKKRYTVSLAKQISSSILAKAEGTFLWVGLAFAELEKAAAKDAVKRLGGLPAGLDAVYQKLLEQTIKSAEDDANIIKEILMFVATSLAPVLLRQVCVACNLHADEDPDSRDLFTQETIDSCPLMITVEETAIRLLHKSVKDFFFDPKTTLFPTEKQAHAIMTYRCLDHLTLSYQNSTLKATGEGKESFVAYAAKRWPEHAVLAGEEFNILPQHEDFFQFYSPSREAWLDFLLALGSTLIRPNFSIFHIAARWGILPLFEHAKTQSFLDRWAIDSGDDWSLNKISNMFSRPYASPLCAAAQSEHPDMLCKLLELRLIFSGGRLLLSRETGSEEFGADTSRETYRFPVTYSVISDACKNSNTGYAAMQAILTQRKDELVVTEQILENILSNETHGVSILTLLLTQHKNLVNITNSLIQIAISNRTCGSDMMKEILRLLPNDIEVTQHLLHMAIEVMDTSTVTVMAHQMGDMLRVTAETASHASLNQKHGKGIIRALLNFPIEYVELSNELITTVARCFDRGLLQRLYDMGSFRPTNDLLAAAAGNQTNAAQNLTMLVELGEDIDIDQTLLDNAAGNTEDGYRAMEVLLKAFGSKVCINQETLETALCSAGNDVKLVSLILDHIEEEMDITDDVFESVATNVTMSAEVFSALIEHKLCRIVLTPALITASQKSNVGDRIMLSILQSDKLSIKIEALHYESSLKRIVKHFGPEVVSAFLLRTSNDAQVSEAVLIAAVLRDENPIIEILLNEQRKRCNSSDSKAEVLRMAAARGDLKKFNLLLDAGAVLGDRGGIFDTILAAAAFGGSTEILQAVLDHGADANAEGGLFGSALQAACYKGHKDIVGILIDYGADVNMHGGYCGSVIGAAALSGDVEIVQRLLDQGARVDGEAYLYGSVLQAAVCGGNARIVQMLLENGAEVNVTSTTAYNPDFCAVKFGSPYSLSKKLRRLGVELNTIYDQRGSPLYAAIACDDPYLFQILLDWGADPSRICGTSGNALHEAFSKECFSILELLLRQRKESWAKTLGTYNADGQTCMHLGATSSPRFCKALYDAGADFMVVDTHGRTPFMYACEVGLGRIVEWFLSIGASPHQRDDFGRTPLVLAAGSSLEAVQILCRAGADINQWEKDDEWTPLSNAVASSKLEIVKWLVAQGADVKYNNKQGKSLLHLACGVEELEIAKFLHGAGADLTARDEDDRNLIWTAVNSEKPSHVNWLLSLGADAKSRDKYGYPLFSVACSKSLSMAKQIQRAGGDPHAVPNDGHSALYWAATAGKVDVLRWLLSMGLAEQALKMQSEGKHSPLGSAAEEHLKSCRILYAARFDPHFVDPQGFSILDRAILKGRLDVVRWLIRIGVAVSDGAKHGWPPAHVAAITSLKMLKSIYRAGADFQGLGPNQTNILQKSTLSNLPQLTEWLVVSGLGGQLDATDENGNDALLHAAWKDLQTFQYLYEACTDRTLRNNSGSDVLDSAIAADQVETVRWLLAKKFNLHTVNELGHTKLASIPFRKPYSVFKTLYAAGCRISTNVIMNETVLHTATDKKESNFIRWFIKDKLDDHDMQVVMQATRYDNDTNNLKSLINRPDRFGRTPVHNALRGGLVETLELFAQEDADFDIADGLGVTPRYFISHTAEYQHLQLPQIMSENIEICRDLKSVLKCILIIVEVCQENRYTQPVMRIFYQRLAHSLLVLGRQEDSKLAFGQRMLNVYDYREPESARFFCDICGEKILGVRYVCSLCSDIDVCNLCVRSGDGSKLPLCTKHPLLAIEEYGADSGYGWNKKGEGRELINSVGETRQHWLEKLKKEIASISTDEKALTLLQDKIEKQLLPTISDQS